MGRRSGIISPPHLEETLHRERQRLCQYIQNTCCWKMYPSSIAGQLMVVNTRHLRQLLETYLLRVHNSNDIKAYYLSQLI